MKTLCITCFCLFALTLTCTIKARVAKRFTLQHIWYELIDQISACKKISTNLWLVYWFICMWRSYCRAVINAVWNHLCCVPWLKFTNQVSRVFVSYLIPLWWSKQHIHKGKCSTFWLVQVIRISSSLLFFLVYRSFHCGSSSKIHVWKAVLVRWLQIICKRTKHTTYCLEVRTRTYC